MMVSFLFDNAMRTLFYRTASINKEEIDTLWDKQFEYKEPTKTKFVCENKEKGYLASVQLRL